MPRVKADSCFDLSQLLSDFLRMKNAKKVASGWLIAFLYGPMVDDAKSHIDLLRRFSDQMFLEVNRSVQNGRLGKLSKLHNTAVNLLGWDKLDEMRTPNDTEFCVLVKDYPSEKSLGAWAYSAKQN